MTSIIRVTSLILGRNSSPCIKRLGVLRNNNQIRFAGHAKWQNIKGTKQATDLAKGKMISRYVMMVKRAIIAGNMQVDPKINNKLGDVLAEASRANVPKATLERAIARATNMKILSLNLEIQGPEGCTLIARCETENPNNLRRDVKKILRKFDANLMPDNTLINMFRSQGFIRAATKTVDERDVDQNYAEDAAILANAQDVSEEINEAATEPSLAKIWVFTTDAESLNPCKGILEKQGLKIISTDLDLVPYRYIKFSDETYEKVDELQKMLREIDQVIDIYNNLASD